MKRNRKQWCKDRKGVIVRLSRQKTKGIGNPWGIIYLYIFFRSHQWQAYLGKIRHQQIQKLNKEIIIKKPFILGKMFLVILK